MLSTTGVKVTRKNVWFFFTISPEDIVSKTRIIYSGRMTTYISGESKRALRSKNINENTDIIKLI